MESDDNNNTKESVTQEVNENQREDCNEEEGGGGGERKDNWNQDEPERCRKLFVGGLKYGTTEDILKAYFTKWGEIVDAIVIKDSMTRESRGFGFVTYSRSFMVDEAQKGRPHKVDGRIVETKRAVPREDIGRLEAGKAKAKKIYVGGLNEELKEEDLRNYFKSFGNVSIVILLTTNGIKRGFGFVEFDDYDAVDKVLLSKHHEIQGKRVDVRRALTRTEMATLNKGIGGRSGSHFFSGGPEDSPSGGPPREGGGGHNQNRWGERGGGRDGGNWGGSWGSGGYSTGPWEQPPGCGGQWGAVGQGNPRGCYGGSDFGGYQRNYGGAMRGVNQYGSRPAPYQSGGYSAPTGSSGSGRRSGSGGDRVEGYNRRF